MNVLVFLVELKKNILISLKTIFILGERFGKIGNVWLSAPPSL